LRAKLLLILSFAFFTVNIYAQNLYFEHINEEKGLNQINILSIHQGPNGYIWIGTYFGLLRYDGYEFENIITLDGAIEESMILSISSNLNQVFALSRNKLFVIDKNTLENKKIEFPTNKIIKPKKIIALRNCILIAAENGLWRLTLESTIFENIHPGSPIRDIQNISTGKVIYSKADGFYAYYPFSQKKKNIAYKLSSPIKHFWLGLNQEIAWIDETHKIYNASIKQLEMKVSKAYEIAPIMGTTCLIKYKNILYLGTNIGLLAISNNGSTSLLQQDDKNFYSLSQNFISCLLVDKTNNLWVGTEIGGLNLHNPERYKFPLASYLLHSNFSKCKEIFSFAETQTGDILWHNSAGTLGTFNPKTQQVTKSVNLGIIGDCIIEETGFPSNFLIGSQDGLFSYKLNSTKASFLSTKNKIKKFEGDIKCILPVGDGTYWMCGEGGFFLYHVRKKETLAFFNIANSTLASNNIRSINFKNKNELLLASTKGLYVFNTTTQLFTLVKLSNNKNEPMVAVAKADKKGNIWIATAGKGIFIWQPNGNIININNFSGLSDNQIHSLTFNATQTQCWATSNNGLFSIETNNFKVNVYHKHNGIQPSEFIEASILTARDGSIYVGGVAGFNYFNPININNEPIRESVVIKNIYVLNQKIPFQAYYKIPNDKNYISFDYASLNFNLSENKTYYYTIEGIDTGYNEVGKRQFVSFGKLSPGDYVFKVKSGSDYGNDNKNEASVSFQIVPNFYQTIWFKIISIVLLVLCISLFIYYKTQSAIKKEKEIGIINSMIAKLELKALRVQMNPHFIFNSLNSIQLFVMTNEGKEAAKYLNKFAKLIRMILDNSEQTFISISSKIELLKLYVDLEALRLNNSFTTTFLVDPNLDQSILIPTLLIQPHIENAIWHGLQAKQGEKILLISFMQLNDETIQVIIEDNGLGRKAALDIKNRKINLHQSKGTKISEDRIALLNKLFGASPKIEIIDLLNENNLACGTKVIINLPIIHE
jgi:ligand-binding sensor domain-containing protein